MAISPGHKRFSVDVPTLLHDALLEAEIIDGCGKTTRTRILLQIWQNDPQLQEQVNKQIRAERSRRRQQD